MRRTGHELHAPAVDLDDVLWEPRCGRPIRTFALIGVRSAEAGREHIATFAVSGDGGEVVHRTAWPGGEEPLRFGPGPVNRPAASGDPAV